MDDLAQKKASLETNVKNWFTSQQAAVQVSKWPPMAIASHPRVTIE